MLVSVEEFREGASPKPSKRNVRTCGEFRECRVFGIGKVYSDPAFSVHFCPAAAVCSRLEEFGGFAKTFFWKRIEISRLEGGVHPENPRVLR